MNQQTHLTATERYQISSLLKAKTSQSEIARILGRHKSTISRELGRNKGLRGYRPKQAHRKYIDRRAKNSPCVTSFGWSYVIHLLEQKHSPEQITGRLRLLGFEDVPSHECIYKFVYADKKTGGKLHQHLRCQKAYRKRGQGGQERRGKLTPGQNISERPVEADKRERIGDYEGDTVIGKKHQGALLTLVDRQTRETKLQALKDRKSARVKQACIDKLKDEQPLSITFDNGKEFAAHKEIADQLNTSVYFANAYSSWERGTNENTNGLIRQFLPKSRRLDNLSDEEVQAIEDNLNNRPRKILGYLTPLEVKSRNSVVALRG